MKMIGLRTISIIEGGLQAGVEDICINVVFVICEDGFPKRRLVNVQPVHDDPFTSRSAITFS